MTSVVTSGEERRETGRIRTFLRGRIIYNHRASTMDCLVRDLSMGGARLALSETATLPDVFELVVPQKSVTYRCNLRWRRTDEVGVVFLDAPPMPKSAAPVADPAMLDLMLRLRQLELANEDLRRRLAIATRPTPEFV